MNFRKEIRIEDRGPITSWLGDSQVWMKTAVERDLASGRGQRGVETDSHELNVAHVCAGLAFELALKALAKSEGRTIKATHESMKNYQALSRASRRRIAQFVRQKMSTTVEYFLQYLDERMCHPDRKYWMVGRKGERKGVSFAENLKGHVIPDLVKVHAEIVQMIGENTFEGWQRVSDVRSKRGPLIATGYPEQDGSIRFEITEEGKKMGVTTVGPNVRTTNREK